MLADGTITQEQYDKIRAAGLGRGAITEEQLKEVLEAGESGGAPETPSETMESKLLRKGQAQTLEPFAFEKGTAAREEVRRKLEQEREEQQRLEAAAKEAAKRQPTVTKEFNLSSARRKQAQG